MRHLPVRVCLALAVATALIVSPGCRRKVEYQTILIDTPTPPGEVPPPVEKTQVEPYRPYEEKAAPAPAPDPAVAAADFSKAYKSAKAPRIALYTNRTLSGDVREWQSDVRGTVGFGATTTKEKEGEKSTKQTEGAVTVSRERRVDDGRGKFLEQKWAWTLEDSMQTELVNAGAKVVDRRIIMRSIAADQPHTAHEDLAVKTIEMKALEGKADILVEVGISDVRDPKRGYIYRLRAFDIHTGTVLVSTNSSTWPLSRRTKGEWVASSEGYIRLPYPEAEKVGCWLATDLMSGLAKQL